MTKTVVHMIGQAHLDPVWLWRWTEGRAEALATSQSAVDRLREYPQFHFVRGESQVYEWIEQENPALFAEILGLMRAGRWHVVNGMVVQPDMNLPQGESLVRQFLLGKSYMMEHLGVEPRVAYCVDSFGHAGTLPQIMSKCGFDAYVFMRPGSHEKTLPAQTFRWQSPDGSQVTAFRIAAGYATRMDDHAQHIDAVLAAHNPELSETMCFFGVGNHGGGPTKRQIENVLAIAAERSDAEICFSSPDAYFAAIAPQTATLPVVAEELQFHAIGCYSANSGLKRAHRQAECSLLAAERLAVMAEVWSGQPAPRQRLRTLWHDLCFNQFHDTLAGSANKEASDEAIMAFGRTIISAHEIGDDAARSIAARADTADHAGGGAPAGTVVLFNPSGDSVSQYAEYEPWTAWEPWRAGGWNLYDESNRPVPCQVLETHEALSSELRGVSRILFRAELPPMGYRAYHFRQDGAQAEAQDEPAPVCKATTTGLENDRLAVRLDPASGNILSCVDKRSGLEMVGPGGWNVAQVIPDDSDTWSHGVRAYGTPECFDAASGCFGEVSSGGTQITVCDNGPLQASVLIERSHGASTWQQQVIVRAGEPELVVHNRLVWQGRWSVVKLAFDVATGTPQATHDVPFGWCNRPCDGSEVPTQMWMDVSGPAKSDGSSRLGLAVINDGKYGCDVLDSTMRLTVLRCPPYAYHHPPHEFGTRHLYDWLDQGCQEFDLVLRPHVGDWRQAGIVERARLANLPMQPVTMHCHPGNLPAAGSLLAVSTGEIEVSALKPAEDGDGYILRLVDRHGCGGAGDIRWLDHCFPVSLAPFEVASLRLARRGGAWQAIPVDMLERLPAH